MRHSRSGARRSHPPRAPIGPSSSGHIAATSSLHGRVTLAGPVPHEQVPALLHEFDALVSATQPTSSETFDKVLCEGGACGLPVVASNGNFADLLEGLPIDSRFPAGNADALAVVLERLATATPEERRRSGSELRRRVLAEHSVDSWADAVIAAVGVDPPE